MFSSGIPPGIALGIPLGIDSGNPPRIASGIAPMILFVEPGVSSRINCCRNFSQDSFGNSSSDLFSGFHHLFGNLLPGINSEIHLEILPGVSSAIAPGEFFWRLLLEFFLTWHLEFLQEFLLGYLRNFHMWFFREFHLIFLHDFFRRFIQNFN